MQNAARVAAGRDRKFREDREPTIATRLGQIGVLGWAIVAPILIGVVLGRWLDGAMKTGIFFTAPLIMLGAVARHVDRVAMDASAMTVALLVGGLRARRGSRARRIFCRCGGASR